MYPIYVIFILLFFYIKWYNYITTLYFYFTQLTYVHILAYSHCKIYIYTLWINNHLKFVYEYNVNIKYPM